MKRTERMILIAELDDAACELEGIEMHALARATRRARAWIAEEHRRAEARIAASVPVEINTACGGLA